MPEIEFVDATPGPGQDEHLDAGRSRRTPRAVRFGVGAVLAVTAAAVLIAVVRDGGGQPAASRPSSQPASRRSSAAPPATPTGTGAPNPPVTTVENTCPVVDACTVTSRLPAAVSRALRERLPHLVDVTGASLLVVGPDPTVRTRRVRGRDGTVAVAVEIHPATRFDHPRAAALDAGTKQLVYARTLTRGLAVTVSASGPPGTVPSLATLRSLAADPRLLSAG